MLRPSTKSTEGAPRTRRLNDATFLIYTFQRKGDEAAIQIMQEIAKKKRPIERLDLGENNLTDAVVDAIIQYLIRNEDVPLARLDLAGNCLTDAGVTKIMKAIEQRSDSPLSQLFLRGNLGVSSEMRGRVEALIYQNALRIKENQAPRSNGNSPHSPESPSYPLRLGFEV
jgi:hypothetical protein